MKKILSAVFAAAAVTLSAADALAADWTAAVEENAENTVLNYTVYQSGDNAVVETIDSCPNDDASAWNVSGVVYQGENYAGSPSGGIRANITKYIKSGDSLKVRFDYRSPGHEGTVYDITPVIEVKNSRGTVTARYEFEKASGSDCWTSYTSSESDAVVFEDGDSVSIAFMNGRGFWHMKDLVIERSGGAATSLVFEPEWHTAASENEENTFFTYTTHSGSDTAAVGSISSCPNDDGLEWNVNGVHYTGENYGGSADGGIRTDITEYVRSGDKLDISFDYRSPSAYGITYNITPVITVTNSAGTVTARYELETAPGRDGWVSYSSGETKPLTFEDGDRVSLSLMNERGFWHMKDLDIKRCGAFISELRFGGALTDEGMTVSGITAEPCTLYTSLYSGGRLAGLYTDTADGAFEQSITCSGADTLKLMAWDGMTPKTLAFTLGRDENESDEPQATEIQDRYKDMFLIGNIYTDENQNGVNRELLTEHYNVITPENLMKPERMTWAKGQYNWGGADAMMDFAEKNGLEVIGHTLVWHNQSAAWLTEGTADEVWDNMEEYISTVVGRYKGRIKGWDVANEAIRDDIDQFPTVWSDYIRKDAENSGTPWYRALQDPEYLYRAYVLAHEADPNAELYYNDYNLDSPYKREAAALLVQHINDKYKQEYNTEENLIDAIGMQSHFSLSTNTENVRASIDRFRGIGVHVNITELDVCINTVTDNGSGTEGAAAELSASDEMKQAVKYAELMSVYIDNADIIDRVTFWGHNDGKSWRASQSPTLFDADNAPKKAFYAVMEPENYR